MNTKQAHTDKTQIQASNSSPNGISTLLDLHGREGRGEEGIPLEKLHRFITPT